MTDPNDFTVMDLPNDLPSDVGQSYKPKPNRDPTVLIAELDAAEIAEGRSVAVWDVVYAHDLERPSGEEQALPPVGGFVLNRIIARGGFGEIWEAYQASLGRVVAVKRVREDIKDSSVRTESTSKEIELSFRQEALTAAKLDHPNILPIYDFGRDSQGRAMLAMKLVRGRSWADIIEADHGSMPLIPFLKKHLPILIRMAQAVAFAHSKGIIHRDLKPSQVMVGEFGETLLMDWGLALLYDPEKAGLEASYQVRTGLIPTTASAPNPAGTIAYMAPEQTEKTAEKIGPWTDVYLLGGTLYYLLTQTVPHNASGNVAAFYKAMTGEYQAPSARRPDLDFPEELELLCRDAMMADPKERLSCPRQFIARLELFLEGCVKKEESLALLNESRQILSSAQSYEELGRARLAANRAVTLWPGNHHAAEVEEQAWQSFVELALKNDDLSLARASASKLRASSTQVALLNQINAKEYRKRTANITRRTLRFSVYTLIVLVVLIITYSAVEQRIAANEVAAANAELRRERDAAAQATRLAIEARDIALEMRAEAEGLANFLAGDLSERLAALGREDLLSEINDRIIDYYDNRLDFGDPDPQAIRNRAEAQRIVAGGFLLQNRPSTALDRLQVAEGLIESLGSEASKDIDLLQELAEIQLTRTEALMMQRRFDEAFLSSELAINLFSELVTAQPASASHVHRLARAIFSFSVILYEQGELDLATRNYESALAFIEEAVRRAPNDPAILLTRAEMAVGQTYLLMLNGDFRAATESQMETIRIQTELLDRQPFNIRLQRILANSHQFLGEIFYQAAMLPESIEAFEESLRRQQQLTRIEGPQRVNAIDAARSKLGLGRSLLQLGNREQASLNLSRAEEILTTVVMADMTNETAAIELGSVYLWQGILVASEDARLGRELLGQGEALLKPEVPSPESSTQLLQVRALVRTMLEDREGALADFAELAARGFRCRDLYEFGGKAGLLYRETLDFQLRPVAQGADLF